jgi:2-polyprenyl-3-methyl-5-hydroxy-6-metoxy-1,4-benzoquinol methylase
MFGNSSTSKSLCRFRVTQAHRKVTVHYFKCERCHFLFSPSFWSFTLSDYRRFVYNEDYVFADPHFKGERPRRDAVALQRILAKSDKSVRILDYGSGIGGLAHRMREQGLTNCDSFDPIYGVGPTPSGKFDSISCFEVIEHVKEQTRQKKSWVDSGSGSFPSE